MSNFLENIKEKLGTEEPEKVQEIGKKFVKLLSQQSAEMQKKWMSQIKLWRSDLLIASDDCRNSGDGNLPPHFFVSVSKKLILPPDIPPEDEDVEFTEQCFVHMLNNFNYALKQLSNRATTATDPLSEWIGDLDRLGVVPNEIILSEEEISEMDHCLQLAKKYFFLSDGAEIVYDQSGVKITMGYVRLQAQARIQYSLTLQNHVFDSSPPHLEQVSEFNEPMNKFLASLITLEQKKRQNMASQPETLQEGKLCMAYAKKYYYLSDETKVSPDNSNVKITMGYIRLEGMAYMKYLMDRKKKKKPESSQES